MWEREGHLNQLHQLERRLQQLISKDLEHQVRQCRHARITIYELFGQGRRRPVQAQGLRISLQSMLGVKLCGMMQHRIVSCILADSILSGYYPIDDAMYHIAGSLYSSSPLRIKQYF